MDFRQFAITTYEELAETKHDTDTLIPLIVWENWNDWL